MSKKHKALQNQFAPVVIHQQPSEISPLSDTFENLPWYISRGLLYLVGIFLVISLIWSVFNRIDVIVVSYAVVTPESRVKEIQAPLPGVVNVISVVEGESVVKGQDVAVIESQAVSQLVSDLQRASKALSDAQRARYEVVPLKVERLQSEIKSLNEKLSHLLPKRKQTLQSNLKNQLEVITLASEQLRAQIEQARKNLSHVQQQRGTYAQKVSAEKIDFELRGQTFNTSRRIQAERVKRLELEVSHAISSLVISNKEFERYQKLHQQEFVSGIQLLKAQKARDDAALHLDQKQSQLYEAKSEAQIILENFTSTENQHENRLRDLQEQLADVDLQITTVRSELKQKKTELALMKKKNEKTLSDLKAQIREIQFQINDAGAEILKKKNEIALLKKEADLRVEQAIFQYRQLRQLIVLQYRGVGSKELEKVVNREETDVTNLIPITTPTDGIISQIKVQGQGEVVTAGQSLMVLVPQGVARVAELMIRNKDVALVKPGMTVKFKFDAFPYTEYGAITGELIKILPHAEVDDKLGSYYRAVASLSQEYFRAKGDKIPLRTGMTASAEIVTQQNSILSMLLKPFAELRHTKEADR